MWWYFVEALSLLLWVTKSCCATESTVLENVAKGFRSEFEAAAKEVLNSYVVDSIDNFPPVIRLPDNFMHAFRPDSGVGNREDLIIKQVRESQVYDDDDGFSNWRYFRFNNSDYLLGTNNIQGVLWKKSIDAVQYLVLSVHEGIFSYSTEGRGQISDSLIFTRRFHYMDILYVAILTEDQRSSFISIYEIIHDKAQMVTVIDLGFSTKGFNWQSSSKITDVHSRHGASLIVLVSGAVAPGIVYQQKGNSLLNHYIEMHFPEAVDMVSFTIGGHAYVAVANKTACEVFKLIEFDKTLIAFETLRSSADIVDLEYFRLGFHHYLAVVAENAQTLYIWKRSGMFEKQSFQSMGVSQAYGVLLPNCRDDVILMFVKTSSSPELLVWNGQSENFISVTVDIPDSFRPVPGTIASYSYSATAYILFFDILKFPKLFAIDTYLRAVNDPVLISGKEVSDLMQSLQEKLSQQEIEIREMSSALENAVRLSGNQQFSALQTFMNLQSTKSISADTGKRPLSIEWQGSPTTLEDYLADPKGLELKVDALETMIEKLEYLLPDIVQIDEPAVITGQKIFTGDVSGSSILAQSLNIDYAAGVNIREVQKELYRLDKPATIQGTLTFSKPLHIIGNLDVIGTVGGIDISRDVLTTNTEQESNAAMFFSKKLDIKGDLSLTGTLNGIDISNELVTLDGNHVVTGNKTFLGGIVADVVQANVIDGVNVNRLLTKSLRKSGKQLINGTKYFNGIVQTGDIALRGKINSYDLNELAASVVRTDQPSSLSGHTTFMEDVIITDTVIVAGVINGLKIPDDLFFKNKSNIITGAKTFSGIVAIGDVTVDGTVNGIKLPQDIITLSRDEIINGTLHFQNGISVKRDIIVNGLVDGVDLSQLADDALQINETNAIKNAVFMGEVTVEGDIFVQGNVNNVSLSDLVADIVYKNEKNVVIRGEKSFTKVIADKIELNGLINGYDIEHDFMTVAGEQTISGTKIFENSVVFQSLTTEDGIVDGVNLTQIYNNRVTLSIDGQVIDGNMNFVDHVIVDDLTIQDSLGGYHFPGDFVLTSTDQEMSNKEFTGSLIVDNLIVSGDVEIQGTLNGIKLPDFLDERVTLTENEDIYGDLTLGDTTAEVVTISGMVNGLNIVDFANNVMSLTKNQTVTEYKEFLGESKVLGSVTTEQGINGIRLRDMNEKAFKLSDDMTISVPVTFTDPVFFENLNVRGLVNGVNLTELNADSVKNVGFQYILGETTFNKGFHVEGDIKTNSVNGMNLAEDFLTRSTDQVIKGYYVFNDLTIEGDLQVSGSVNGIDLDKVAPLLAQRQKINTIRSDLVFKEPVHVSGDIDVSGFVNGMNFKEVEESALLKSGSQHIQGHKTLKGNVTIYGDVNVTFVNDVHWGEFLEDVVRIDVPRTISSRKVWSSDMEVRGDISVSGFADIGLINDVNLTKFVDEAVFVNQPAHITGTKIFSSVVEVAGDLNADLINGLDLQKDVIILQCTENKPQIISGGKIFHNLTVYRDIIVDGYVNGHKLKDLVSNTLSVDGNQTITGNKRFHKEVTFLKDVHAPTVNGLSLSKDLVTLDTEQVIEGDIVFTGDVRIQKNLMVAGPTNGVNLQELAEDALYVDVEQSVDGAYTIENAVVKSDVFVDGLINGFDLNVFSQNVTNFWEISRSDFKHLMEKSDSYCEMVENMYSYLQHSYYILDGFILHQTLSFASDYADVDLKTGELNLVKVRSSDSIADTQKYHLNSASGSFDHIQTQKVDFVKQKRYVFSGRQLLIIFGVSPRDSMVYYDGKALPAITHGFTDGDVVLQNGRAIVALLYVKRSICEIFEIVIRDNFSFDVRPFGNIASEATSIALFDMSGVTYLALAYDSAPAYKRNSEVHAYLKRDWQLVQNIIAAGSSRVLHFSFHDYHYLVFVNNIPTYKTKEPMAVQVYRSTDAEAVPFGLFQKIPFDDAKMLEIFKFGDLEELYLVIASELKVQVFRLEGESGFATTFVLYGKCVSFVKPFLIGNELYLLVSDKDRDSMNVSTVIYKGITQGWRIPSRKFEHCS